MSAASLMARLLEIERSAGFVGPLEIRAIAIQAQNDLMELERGYGSFLQAQVARDEAEIPRGTPHECVLQWPEVSSRLQTPREEPADPSHLPLAGLKIGGGRL